MAAAKAKTKKCPAWCPPVVVKCATRKHKGKIRCTVKMAGKTWKRTEDNVQAKVAELRARNASKGCAVESGPAFTRPVSREDIRAARRVRRKEKKLTRRNGSVAENYAASTRAYSPPSAYYPEPSRGGYDPDYDPFD